MLQQLEQLHVSWQLCVAMPFERLSDGQTELLLLRVVQADEPIDIPGNSPVKSVVNEARGAT